MKSLIILLLAVAGCTYGAYSHFAEKESAIAASVSKKERLQAETEKTRSEAAALKAELDEKSRSFAEESVAIPRSELAKARAEEAKGIAAATAELDAAKQALEAAQRPGANPEADPLVAQVAALEAAFAKLDKENIRLLPIFEAEKAVEVKRSTRTTKTR